MRSGVGGFAEEPSIDRIDEVPMRRHPVIAGFRHGCETGQMPIAPPREGVVADRGDAEDSIRAASYRAVGLHQVHGTIQVLLVKLWEALIGVLRRAVFDPIGAERAPPRDVPLAEPALAVVENNRALNRYVLHL